MSTLTVAAPSLNDSFNLTNTFFRVSVERYHRMITAGIFTEDDAVELLDGWIVNKMARNRRHIIVTTLVSHAFAELIDDQHHIETESVLTLATSEPEPDVMIVRGSLLDYDEHPTGHDVPLLVEVADSSLQRDQTHKKQIYAAAEIPVYWVVNLPERQIEVYSQPSGVTANPNYYQLQSYRSDDEIPVLVDGREIGRIPVKSLLPF